SSVAVTTNIKTVGVIIAPIRGDVSWHEVLDVGLARSLYRDTKVGLMAKAERTGESEFPTQARSVEVETCRPWRMTARDLLPPRLGGTRQDLHRSARSLRDLSRNCCHSPGSKRSRPRARRSSASASFS